MWTEYIPQCGDLTAGTLARAFMHWAVAQPDNVQMALRSSYVRGLYKDAHQKGWPPFKDFAEELKYLMPRRRYWRNGYGKRGPTVYHVPEAAAVVELAAVQRQRA